MKRDRKVLTLQHSNLIAIDCASCD